MAKKTEQKTIVSQLVVRPPVRKTNDIGTWRNALISADAGRVKSLYDLFEDLLIDGVLADAIDKRIQAVTNSAVTFQDANGKNVPEIETIIDTEAFEELEKTIMQSVFWGRSGGEFAFNELGFTFTPFPAKHIKTENKAIILNDTDENGVEYETDPFILVTGKTRNYGLLLKAAPYVIWKRGGFGDYAQWLEIFGMPQRVGKYSSYDPESRKLLEQALELAGSAPWVVIPKETEVETTSNSGGGSGDNYNDFRKACNEEVLITILGQTLTTTQNDTGARSLGEVHKTVEEGKNKADMRFVERVLNQHVLPLLESRGYPVKGGKFIFPESPVELTVDEMVKLTDIIDIPKQFIHDKYSIPMAANGEFIAKKTANSQILEGEPAGGAGKTKPEEDPEIKNMDKGFWKGLFSFFAAAPGRGANLKLKDYTKLTIDVVEAYDIPKLVEAAMKNIFDDSIDLKNSIEPNLFKIVFDKINSGITEAFPEIAYNHPDIDFIYELQHNSAVFSVFKVHKEQNEIARQLVDADGNLKDFSTFKKDTAKIVDKNHRWLETEYDTAVLRARNSAKWKEFERDSDLFPNLKWIESTSVEKRPDHVPFYNMVLPINHPFWKSYYPGNLWNCKCGIRNTDDAVTEIPATPMSAMKPDKGLDENPAFTGELFTKSHPIFKDTEIPAKKLDELAQRTADEVVENIKKKLKSEAK